MDLLKILSFKRAKSSQTEADPFAYPTPFPAADPAAEAQRQKDGAQFWRQQFSLWSIKHSFDQDFNPITPKEQLASFHVHATTEIALRAAGHAPELGPMWFKPMPDAQFQTLFNSENSQYNAYLAAERRHQESFLWGITRSHDQDGKPIAPEEIKKSFDEHWEKFIERANSHPNPLIVPASRKQYETSVEMAHEARANLLGAVREQQVRDAEVQAAHREAEAQAQRTQRELASAATAGDANSANPNSNPSPNHAELLIEAAKRQRSALWGIMRSHDQQGFPQSPEAIERSFNEHWAQYEKQFRKPDGKGFCAPFTEKEFGAEIQKTTALRDERLASIAAKPAAALAELRSGNIADFRASLTHFREQAEALNGAAAPANNIAPASAKPK